MNFLKDSYLLENKLAEEVYSNIRDLPIFDPHTHVNVKKVVKNNGWSDIWEVEGATDHYVWELMRKRGVEEEKITGDASNKEKWNKLAEIFPDLVGNPTYEWIHLDIKRRFGIEKVISSKTAEEIWTLAKEELYKDYTLPQNSLRDMGVKALCSTDNPSMELKYHQQGKEKVEGVGIYPTWRPDKFLRINHNSWKKWIRELGEETEKNISDLQSFKGALKKTHDYFDKVGCLASDHGLEKGITKPVSEKEAAKIFLKGFEHNKNLNQKEIIKFKSFLLTWFGTLNRRKNWVMQLHIGAMRDYREELFQTLGRDSGGDVLTQSLDLATNLKYFLNRFDGELDIVLYYLDPTHLPMVATLSRAFPNVSIGAPWWFNDTPVGIEKQLRWLGSIDLLANHAGMVSDSRKLMSFGSRVEIFRRCLSNTLGKMIDRGRVPKKVALKVARNIAHTRKKDLFGFDK